MFTNVYKTFAIQNLKPILSNITYAAFIEYYIVPYFPIIFH